MPEKEFQIFIIKLGWDYVAKGIGEENIIWKDKKIIPIDILYIGMNYVI